MFSLNAQYFLSFAVMGSLLPFFPVYLRQQGLGLTHVGYIGASASVAVLLTPVWATLLADGKVSGRRLLGVIFAVSGATLAALYYATGFWPILVLFSLYSLTFAATTSLQDGLNFLVQARQKASGARTIPYHRVRVWGTLGFIMPNVLLFGFLRQGYPIRLIMISGATFSVLGLFNSFLLPHFHTDRPGENTNQTTDNQAADQPPRLLPTLAAARAMLEPHVLVFCLAMGLLHMAVAAYYTFYPIYLRDRVGLSEQWLGVVANLGVVIEIVFMLGFGRMLAELGLKRFMALGGLCITVRLTLLASSDGVWVAVGTQALHGIMVLVMHVAPPIFLNRHADNSYRNSMQGLYVMVVYGVGRIVGNTVAGHVAASSLTAVFTYAAALCGLAVLLFAFAFHDRPQPVAGDRVTTTPLPVE